MSGPDVFDEAELRRALRLEPSERPPRLDARSLELVALRDAVRERRLLGAVGLATVASALALAALNAIEPVDAAIALVQLVSAPLDVAVRIVTAPVTPLAVLAAALVALATEQARERSRPHAHAS